MTAAFVAEAFKARRISTVRPARERLTRSFRAALKMERVELLRNLSKLADYWPLTPVLIEDALPRSAWLPALVKAQARSGPIMRQAVRRYGARAIQAGANQAAVDVDMGLSFDLANPVAVSFLEQRAALLVTRIEETTREALRALLVQSAQSGWSYQTTANAIRQDFAFSPARSEVIARTEITNAYSEGNIAGARELQDQGVVMEKAWLVNVPEDDGCISNGEAGWIGIEASFPSGDTRPPVHPNCECDLIFRRVGSESD